MDNSDDFHRITNAYSASLELWKLASEQIYSRFAAMLTGNSIIIAMIGIALTDRVNIPVDLLRWLIIAGLCLCLLWGYFIFYGVRVENHYRERAAIFEKKAIPHGDSIAIKVGDKKYGNFKAAAFLTVGVFAVIYVVLMSILQKWLN